MRLSCYTSFIACLLACLSATAQTQIVYQGFEQNAADTWTATFFYGSLYLW